MSSSRNKMTSRLFKGDGDDRKIRLGYQPRKVEIHNITDVISYDKMGSMELEKSIKTIANGTQTYVDSVSIQSDGFTLIAAENVDTKDFRYAAYEAEND